MKKKIITFGEVLMRLTPENYATFAQTKSLSMEFGGGEANVGITLAYLGEDSLHVTAPVFTTIIQKALIHLDFGDFAVKLGVPCLI